MRILIVEDDKKVAGFLKKGLKEEHYAVDVCYDGEEALFQSQVNQYDLMILDVMLPKKNGFAICKQIREEGNLTPILMLTAKDQLEDKIKGLQEGADDYLTKPFAFEELLARIKALLRRSQDYKTKTMKVGSLELDPVSRKVTRENKPLSLTGKEYALLEYLMSHGVVPKFDTWNVSPWSGLAGNEPPPLEYYIRIDQAWCEIWQKYSLPPVDGMGPMGPGRAREFVGAFRDTDSIPRAHVTAGACC